MFPGAQLLRAHLSSETPRYFELCSSPDSAALVKWFVTFCSHVVRSPHTFYSCNDDYQRLLKYRCCFASTKKFAFASRGCVCHVFMSCPLVTTGQQGLRLQCPIKRRTLTSFQRFRISLEKCIRGILGYVHLRSLPILYLGFSQSSLSDIFVICV